MFDGQAGLAKCQKSRPGWDSDPQSLNGLIWHNRSPMRYAKLHRARRCARVCHLKVLLLVLCPSCSVRFASSVHRKERSSGLCPIDTHFKKATALSESPAQLHDDRQKPPSERHRWGLFQGPPVYKTGALTS